MSTYRLYVDGAVTEHRVKGTKPAAALRELCVAAELQLASQSGRYGHLDDGRSAVALTEPWGRVDGPEARTTRIHNTHTKRS
jgi:hypothetical protein